MNKKIVLTTLIFTVFLTGCGKKQNEDIKPIASKPIFELPAGASFVESLGIYSDNLKKIAIAVQRDDISRVEVWALNLAEAGDEIAKRYSKNKPIEYSKTSEWEKELVDIAMQSKKINELVKEKNLAQTRELVNNVRFKLQKIRRENNIKNISDDMLDLQVAVDRLNAESQKKQSLDAINDFKFNFTKLKEYRLGEEYDKIISEIEAVISQVDYTTGSSFESAKQKLKPLFIKLLINFG